MANTGKVTGQIRRFLDERGFGCITDEKGVIRGTVSGEAAQWPWAIFLCGQDNAIVSFRAFCPIKVKTRRRTAAAEYLTRANWGLNFGNFEMDWSDGEVNFRASVPTSNAGISVKALSDPVYCPCGMMERYLAGLLAVAVGNADPKRRWPRPKRTGRRQHRTSLRPEMTHCRRMRRTP